MYKYEEIIQIIDIYIDELRDNFKYKFFSKSELDEFENQITLLTSVKHEFEKNHNVVVAE